LNSGLKIHKYLVNLESYLQCAKSFVNASPNTKVVDGRMLDDTLLVNNEKPPESNALQGKNPWFGLEVMEP